MAVQFTDDFETGDTSKWDSAIQTSGTLTVESLNPRYGSKHLRTTTIAGTGQKRVYVQKILAPTTTKNIRAYVYLNPTTLLPAERVTLLVIYGSATGLPTNYVATVTVVGGNLVLYYQDGTDVYKTANPNIPMPTGNYVCLEIGVKIGSGNGEIHVWLDGTEIITVANVNNALVGDVVEARTGLVFTDATTAQTADVDEVAIGDSYIGPYQPPLNGGAPFPTMWIIGGVVSAIVVIGAILLLRRKK